MTPSKKEPIMTMEEIKAHGLENEMSFRHGPNITPLTNAPPKKNDVGKLLRAA
jgi:hypothetical protein